VSALAGLSAAWDGAATVERLAAHALSDGAGAIGG